MATPARPPDAFAGWGDAQPSADGAPGDERAQAPPAVAEPAAPKRAPRKPPGEDERAVVDAQAWIESVRAQGGVREKAETRAPSEPRETAESREWADPAAPRKRAERRGGGTRRGASAVPAEPSGESSGEPSADTSGERAEERRPRATRRGGRTEPGESRGRKARRDEDVDPAAKAKEICYRLLAMRAHTRLELAQALRRKQIPDDVAETVLGKFDNAGLIDDAAFAEMWVRSRHEHQGLGRRALAVELKRRGVDSSVVSEAVDAVDDDAEEERAAALVRKRMRAMSGVDEQAKIRRLVGMLARKGYGQGMAYRVVRAELGAEGLDELQD